MLTDAWRKEIDVDVEEGGERKKRGRFQEGGISGSGVAESWWTEEGFGQSYEPFNPMEYEEVEQAKGQKRVATEEPEGEEDRVYRG